MKKSKKISFKNKKSYKFLKKYRRFSGGDNKYLAIIATFKNEGHILIEWIEHYLKMGVDHFFFLNR